MRSLRFQRHTCQANDHQQQESTGVNVIGDPYFGPEPGWQLVSQLSVNVSLKRGGRAASSDSGRQVAAIQVARRLESSKAQRIMRTIPGANNVSNRYMTKTTSAA